MQAIRGALGRGADGQKDNGDANGPDNLDQNKAMSFIRERWEDLKNAYIVYHQSIWQALLFYANQSWIDWDDARKVWQPQQPTDEWVPRPRINRFSPTIDAVTSNIYQVPEVEAVPREEEDLDPESAMVADIATKLAAYALDKEGLKNQRDMHGDRSGLAANLFVLCGGLNSIIQVTPNTQQTPVMGAQPTQGYMCQTCDQWKQMPIGQPAPAFCPDCGNPVEPEDSEAMGPMMNPDGSPQMQQTGDYTLSLRIESNLNSFPRPGATSLQDSPYLVLALRRPLDMIYFMFDKFEAQPDSLWPDGYAVTYEHALNFWYTGYSNSTIQVKDSCLTLECYVPPNKVKDFPDGFYGVMINDKQAHMEEWTFPDHPVTYGYYLVLPTIFFPRSIGFDLVEIQRELNAYESVIKLHAMVAAVDPIVIDQTTLVSEITGRSDKVIKWRSIGPNSEPPHRMGAGHLDDGIYKQRDNLHAEFQNISMAVNAFRGEQEGAITAAAAIQQLRSQAELMFSKPVANWNNFWTETIRKYVRFIQFYFTVDKIAEIIGPGYDDAIMAFKRSDLNATLQWVSSSHGTPKTRDERRQEFMVLWDKGALDLSDPTVRNKIYELFGETGMQQSFNQDATNARIENQEFKAWTPMMPPLEIHPMPLIEDMAVHLYFHKFQAKSQTFRKWPPANKQLLIQHIIETQMEMMKMMMQAQAMQAGPDKDKEGGGKPGEKSQAQVNGGDGAAASAQGSQGGPS